jgi:hypothetical protein
MGRTTDTFWFENIMESHHFGGKDVDGMIIIREAWQ